MVFIRTTLSALITSALIGGCSLIEDEHVDGQSTKTAKHLHERRAVVSGDVASQSVRELVYGDVQQDRELVSGENRVVWIEGIDQKSTKIQRPSERNLSIQSESPVDVLGRP